MPTTVPKSNVISASNLRASTVARGYGSFADYFEDRAGQPFHTWAELESTYPYAKQYAPELFEGPYDKA